MTMGMDMSPLFGEVVACMSMQVLEIKKMVSEGQFILACFHSLILSHCVKGLSIPQFVTSFFSWRRLYLTIMNAALPSVNYARSKPEMMKYAMDGFLAVCYSIAGNLIHCGRFT
jgi:hypothetical protein